MEPIDITIQGIASLITNLKTSTSAGIDGINSKVLKNTISILSQILFHMFRQYHPDSYPRTGKLLKWFRHLKVAIKPPPLTITPFHSLAFVASFSSISSPPTFTITSSLTISFSLINTGLEKASHVTLSSRLTCT